MDTSVLSHLVAVAAELILTMTCLAIVLELSVARKPVHKLAAVCVASIGIAAMLGALRYTGVGVAAYHQWMSEIASYFGIVGLFTLLAGTVKRDGVPLFLLLLVSVFGYFLQQSWLKDVAIIGALSIQGISLYQQGITAYRFITAALAILAAGGLSLLGFENASWQEAIFHVLIAVAVHQYFKQYTQRP